MEAIKTIPPTMMRAMAHQLVLRSVEAESTAGVGGFDGRGSTLEVGT